MDMKGSKEYAVPKLGNADSAKRVLIQNSKTRGKEMNTEEIMQAASSWKPIETAPKDGSQILVTDGNLFCVVLWGGFFWIGGRLEKMTLWAEMYPPEGKP